MKVLIFVPVVIFLCLSCNSKRSKIQKKTNVTSIDIKKDTLENQLKNNKMERVPKDTILIFSIDGLSAEGSEVKAHYINGVIRDATWNIYGETGQSVIYYKFLKGDTVKTEEKNYIYKGSLTEVNSEKDMNLKSSLQYILDTNGVVLSKINEKDFVNVFTDFKKHVPMVLLGLNWQRTIE
jgi:hypothetical protein